MTQTEKHQTAREVLEIIPPVMRIVAAELRQTKYSLVPAQLGVLSTLIHHSGNLSELAEEHGVSLPTMSSTISKMVALGWVKRTRARHDRRMVLIELTPAGQAVFEEMRDQVVDQLAALLRPLSTEQEEALLNGLAVLKQLFANTPFFREPHQ